MVKSSDKDSANHLAEWKQARDVLKHFDEKLHDLRKYGFTFLTGLLAVESILIPTSFVTTIEKIPDSAKFAIFTVTLILIIALHLLDRNYVVFQQAANTRAKVLERELNLELSEIISIRYANFGIKNRVLTVYLLFIIGVGVSKQAFRMLSR